MKWCCFCGKTRHQVKNLIETAPVPTHTACGDHQHRICGECVELCANMLLDEKMNELREALKPKPGA